MTGSTTFSPKNSAVPLNVLTVSLVALRIGRISFWIRSEEHTSELQSQSNLVCRLLLEKKNQNVGDRLALEQDLERLAVVAFSLADVAGDVDVGQKVHLDLDDAVALAGLAAAALDVEGEAAGLVAARFGLGQAGEPLADRFFFNDTAPTEIYTLSLHDALPI